MNTTNWIFLAPVFLLGKATSNIYQHLMHLCFYRLIQKIHNNAIKAGFAAGTVLDTKIEDDENDTQLRLGFDFDGVIADDSSEQFYKNNQGNMTAYHQHEHLLAENPLKGGPIGSLLQKISLFQRLEDKRLEVDPNYKRILSTAIITARNAPAHERVVTTLKSLNIEVNDVFFLGGIDKSRILNILKPHIFFDDQMTHL